jgi:hypothetical protein
MLYGQRVEDLKATITLLRAIRQSCLQKDAPAAIRLNCLAKVQECLAKAENTDKYRQEYGF